MSYLKNASDYKLGKLNIEQCPDNPMILFKKWIYQAKKNNIKDYNAMVISTCTNNEPNSRVVLCKKITDDSLFFFSNYLSIKGKEIQKNSLVHLLFFWADLERQVRLCGHCEKVKDEISDDYFYSREKKSQIASIVSQQSSKLPSRAHLEKLVEQRQKNQLNRPNHWGGYQIKIKEFEFWQGRENRLNDRVKYEKKEGWQKYLLFP